MKKLLKILGILLIIAAVLAFLLAALWQYARMNTCDGSADMYEAQRRAMLISLAAGAVLAAAGVGCLLLRKRL